VQAITRGCLGNLHTPNCDIPVQDHLQVWCGFQRFLQGCNFYAKSVPRDLYHRLQRPPIQADNRRCSCKALIANDASFGGFAIFHYDDKRNQTSIREIRKLQPSTGLVKD
jgi:hypothetical protein